MCLDGIATPAVRVKRSRKPHPCDLCPDEIPAGSSYDHWCWIADGSATTTRVHDACWDLLRAYSDPDCGTYEVSPEALEEALRAHQVTLEDAVQVAGEDGARVWRLYVGEEAPDGE